MSHATIARRGLQVHDEASGSSVIGTGKLLCRLLDVTYADARPWYTLGVHVSMSTAGTPSLILAQRRDISNPAVAETLAIGVSMLLAAVT